ncbi:MAG TPA: glycosyltransferase family 39 protein [Polyangiaceae bacterium]|nr:glycosyltransferase family 39 protein [Polyangiaceae bacterium]
MTERGKDPETDPPASGRDDAPQKDAAVARDDAADVPRALDVGVVAVSIAVVIASALLVLSFGHGRDQSIYALVAREMLDGKMPYRDAFDFKPPGIFCVYALARVLFGDAIWGIRALEVASMLGSAALLVRLAKRHVGSARVGWVAAALASQVHAQLDFWHTGQPETFGGTLTLAGLLLASMAAEPSRPARRRALLALASGAIFGVAGLMKPPLAGVGALIGVALAWQALRAKKQDGVRFDLRSAAVALGAVAVGGALPIALTLAWFRAKGALGDLHEVLFVFTPYYTKISWENQSVLAMGYYGIAEWLTTYSSALLAGLVALAVTRPSRRELVPVLLVLGAIGIHITGIVMQAKFFPYHWGATFPLTAALAALGFDKVLRFAWRHGRWVGAVAFFVVFGVVASAKVPVPSMGEAFLYRARVRWQVATTAMSPADKTRAWDDLSTVAGVSASQNREVGVWIKEHTEPTDPIFVWGFECAIYDFAERPLASRYIYDVPQRAVWSAAPMQAALTRELDAKPPKIIVVEHGDVFPFVTGSNDDSAQALWHFPALRDRLDSDYRLETTIGSFDVYARDDGESSGEALR